MPRLSAEDLTGWDRTRLAAEHADRLERVRAIRDQAGGSLVNVTDPGQADEVRNLMADTNQIGERIEALADLDGLEAAYASSEPERHAPEGVTNGRPEFPRPGQGGGQVAGPRDLGALFIASAAWQTFKASGSREIVATLPTASLFPGWRGAGEVPSMRSATFDSGDFPSQPQFLTEPIETLYQENNIGARMAQGTTDRSVIRYPVETVTATGAAAVAEGVAKPEANLNFTATDENVRKIAVWVPVTDEILEDEAFLRAYLNARLRLFVMNEEDRQLLIGTGTAPEIRGIMNRSGIDASTSYSIGGANPDQALLDALFSAQMRVRESFLLPDTQVMRAATWEVLRLAKDANRNYILGPPADDAPLRVWGLPVVLNENMPAIGATNEPALVGAFRTASMLVRRSGIDLAMSDQHASFFVENKVAIRAEERVALAVFRPAGFATVTSAA